MIDSSVSQEILWAWPVLLLSPKNPLFLCLWLLIIILNCSCILLWWVIIPWFHGNQLPKTSNLLRSNYHPKLLPNILPPGLPLMLINKFLLPPPLLIRILLNMSCSKRERRVRTISFRRRTSRWKRTEWLNYNLTVRVNKWHYTDLITLTPNHFPLYFFFVLLESNRLVYSSVTHLI